jgi:hypothetical protein
MYWHSHIYTFLVLRDWYIKSHKANQILSFIYSFSKYGPFLAYLIFYSTQKYTFTVPSYPLVSHYPITLDKFLHIHETWYTATEATPRF